MGKATLTAGRAWTPLIAAIAITVRRGATFSGQPIRGVDSVRVVPESVWLERFDRGKLPPKR